MTDIEKQYQTDIEAILSHRYVTVRTSGPRRISGC